MKPDIEKIVFEIRDDIRFLKDEITEIKRLLLSKTVERENDLLTVNQVAQEFSVNPNMIYSACSGRNIPFEKRGRSYRLRRQDVVRWIDDMQRNTNDRTSVIDDVVSSYLQKNQRLSI